MYLVYFRLFARFPSYPPTAHSLVYFVIRFFRPWVRQRTRRSFHLEIGNSNIMIGFCKVHLSSRPLKLEIFACVLKASNNGVWKMWKVHLEIDQLFFKLFLLVLTKTFDFFSLGSPIFLGNNILISGKMFRNLVRSLFQHLVVKRWSPCRYPGLVQARGALSPTLNTKMVPPAS